MSRKYLCTIFRAPDGKISLSGVISDRDYDDLMVTMGGKLLPIDIGKRAYRIGGIVQVENDEQRDARLRAEQKP